MARKKADIVETDTTRAPNFNTSASIESGLADHLYELESGCLNKFKLSLARSAENRAQEALIAFNTKRKGYESKDTGLVATSENSVTGKPERIRVTVGMMERWFETYPQLAKAYQTVGTLLASLVKFGQKNTRIINDRAVYRADNLTPTTMLLSSPTTQYTYHPSKFLDRYRCRLVTQADRDFLYKHLRKNGARGHEVVYWMAPEGAIAVPRAEKTGDIPEGDTDFWNAFYAENDEKIAEILHDIEAAAYKYEAERPIGTNGMPLNFDDILLTIAPQCLLQYAVLTKRMRTEEEEDGTIVTRFDCYMVECQNGSLDRSSKRDKWKTALSKAMMSDLVMDEVDYAPQFSNTPGKGLVSIPLSGVTASGDTWAIDVNGRMGRQAAENGESAPELPSEFRRFFFGEHGDRCIFQSDPRMSLLRLADFLYRVLVEKTQCRQCLVLSGAGKDGKSVLIKVLQGVMQLREATLDAEKLDDPAATYAVLNAPMVVLPEVRYPGKVFKTSFFKSLTGGDTLPLRQLYHMAIAWTPEHSRLMMTTNNPVYVYGDAQVSRCLPIAMQQAYDQRTARSENEIIASCLSQRIEFLQWVCDTRAYYQSIRTKSEDGTGVFMPDRLMIVTDDDFDAIVEGEMSLLDASERERRQIERRAMEATGSGRFFVSYNEEASEDEAEWYEKLFDALLEPAESESIARADLATALMSAVEVDAKSKQPRCPEVKHAVDALGISTAHLLRDKAFTAFKAWMENEGRATLIKPKGNFRYKGVRLKTNNTDEDL